MGYARVCRFCWGVAHGEQPYLVEGCSNCEPAYRSTNVGEHLKSKYAPLKLLLWSSLPQYQILPDSGVENIVDAKGNTILFDFVIPECRVAIDFIGDDQFIQYDTDYRGTERVELDDAKLAGTRSANYRWIQLPTDPDEARVKLLEQINEVYVKDVDGKLHILTPRLQGDAGWDLVSDEDTLCLPGVGTDIPSQVYLEIPNHLYAIVQARSSTSKKRLLVLPGVIDPAYRGQIFTMTFNPTTEPVMVKKGDRISQLLFFYRIPHLHIDPVLELRKSERGSRGFGSTGG